MSKNQGNSSARGPGQGEGWVQRLLRSAFRPANARAEFRDELIQASLNILSDHRRPGLNLAEPASPGQYRNVIAGSLEAVRRQAAQHRRNRLEGSSEAEAPDEEQSAELRARQRRAGI